MANTKNQSNGREKFSNIFLLVILIGSLYLCYLLIKPFLTEIVLAGVLVTIFYPIFLKVVYWTRGKISLSAFIMCVFILSIIIVPFSYFIFYLAQQAIVFYSSLASSGNIVQYLDVQVWQKLNFVDENIFNLQQFIIDSVATIRAYLVTGATSLVRGTTQFFVSLILVIFTMFFLFRDGRSLLSRVMKLTPLSNKYDKLIWMKFRDVSYSAIVATFLTALAQAFSAGLAFFVVGLPVLLLSILIFVVSFLPYIGTALVWLPVAVYLLIIGKIWQGIFLIIWGVLVISLIDNFLRPYLIKDKADVHPIIVFFSIFGGLILFGAWGVIFGPLIVSLAVTILHIYELQYAEFLER